MGNDLGKEYKLCSHVIIEDVFATGDLIKSYPFVARIKLTKLPKQVPFQLVFSAPKRTFRKAYQRNKVKRLCKEAFRLNKYELESALTDSNKQLALFLVFTSRDKITFDVLEKRVQKLIKKIIIQLESHD
ncbi:MAG: ribonuclease P protein component [Crocinitomicaceae bacterium]|nr:ribonuclease P protein component [Crocinitomicaceae bacterium]MDG2440544.1 ribonuclease P protein component [Crocinitomicaceae bacterium]|tara:strand:- start:15010 stop:15399 length:390 start_codon:yes stop_codon:yes gene_type:complete